MGRPNWDGESTRRATMESRAYCARPARCMIRADSGRALTTATRSRESARGIIDRYDGGIMVLIPGRGVVPLHDLLKADKPLKAV